MKLKVTCSLFSGEMVSWLRRGVCNLMEGVHHRRHHRRRHHNHNHHRMMKD